MLVTEEEAKKRWCPFAKYAAAGPHPSWPEMPTIIAPQSRAWGLAQDSCAFPQNCIASECMAWRKQESAAFALKANAEFERTGAILESTEGFCGLAGKP